MIPATVFFGGNVIFAVRNELTKSDAFKEEYRIKRLSKAMKEGIIDTGGNKKKSPGVERQG